MSVQKLYEGCASLRDGANRHSISDNEDIEFCAFLARHARTSCSQIFQDLWVLYELGLKREGFFVEFGACDGVNFSNSLLLEKEYGWRGILAEPDRRWHESISKNRSCLVSHKAVSAKGGLSVEFIEGSDAMYSTIKEFAERDYHAGMRKDGKVYEVETISLDELLAIGRAPGDIDFMSLDTEGGELETLKSMNFEKYNIKCISIEHNHTSERGKIYDFLTGQGYQRKFSKFSQFDDWYTKI